MCLTKRCEGPPSRVCNLIGQRRYKKFVRDMNSIVIHWTVATGQILLGMFRERWILVCFSLPLQLWTNLYLAAWFAIIAGCLLLLGETVCVFGVRMYLEKVNPWEDTDLYYQLYEHRLLGLRLFFSTYEHSAFSGPAQFQIVCLIILIGTYTFVSSRTRFLFSGLRDRKIQRLPQYFPL